MKTLIASMLLLFASTTVWTNDLGRAKLMAQEQNKKILLNFSGSDWCGPCIMLKKKAFSTQEFEALANEKLILMRADFPRLKKNRLPANETQKNEVLAEKYNPQGKFPLTLLLNVNGEVLKEWDGFDGNSKAFLASLASAVNE